MHDTKTPLLIGGAAMLLNLVLSLTLPPLFESAGWFAHGGLALANSLATTLELVGLLWIIRSRLGGLEGRRLLPMLLRGGVATALMGFALAVLVSALPSVNPLLLGPASIALGVVVYSGTAWVLGVPEVRAAVLQLRRWIKASDRTRPTSLG